MSTDRAELAADDFAAVLGPQYRVRVAYAKQLWGSLLVYERTLGVDHPTTTAAFMMYIRARERVQECEGAA